MRCECSRAFVANEEEEDEEENFTILGTVAGKHRCLTVVEYDVNLRIDSAEQ
jgi:hypothetical protein